MAYLNKDGAEHLVEKIRESHWGISKVRDAAKKKGMDHRRRILHNHCDGLLNLN